MTPSLKSAPDVVVLLHPYSFTFLIKGDAGRGGRAVLDFVSCVFLPHTSMISVS